MGMVYANRTLIALVLGLMVGLQVTQFVAKVDAAPSDVIGSPNVAVDSWRSQGKTFILFSDGRILDAAGGSNDLGHPYQQPDASANISNVSYTRGRPHGSPNVAVGTVRRSDGTFVLFADGSLRVPNDPDAASGDTENKRLITGMYIDSGFQYCNGGTLVSTGQSMLNEARIVFDRPYDTRPVVVVMPIGSSAFFATESSQSDATLSVSWAAQQDGRGYSFVVIGED